MAEIFDLRKSLDEIMMKVRGRLYIFGTGGRLCGDQTVISDFSDGATRPVSMRRLFPEEFIASSSLPAAALLDEFTASQLTRARGSPHHRVC